MKISVVTTGRFHVLDLARELAALGHELQFFSCVPRKRAAKFGLPAGAHRRGLLAIAPLLLAQRHCAPARARRLEVLTLVLADRMAALLLEPCDVFVGMSGLCRCSLRSASDRFGALTVLERGSRHVLSQKRILEAIPGAARPAVPGFSIERELWGYEHADMISVPSHHVVRSFLDEGVPGAKLFRNPYGVDLGMFPPTSLRSSPPPQLLFVGNWSLQKGCDILWSACDGNGWSLMHVGALGDAPVPASPLFTHSEPVSQERLVEFYQEASVFVLASRQDGFGMVLAQALSCGLPLVCTERTGGQDLRECLDDPRWVTVVPVDDPEALANGVRRALAMAATQSGPREILGAAREKLSWRAYGTRMAAELERRLALRPKFPGR